MNLAQFHHVQRISPTELGDSRTFIPPFLFLIVFEKILMKNTHIR